MVSKRIFIASSLFLLIIIAILALVIIRPFNRHEIRTSESAITLAKAALIRKYGETEFLEMSFIAVIHSDRPQYWYVSEHDPTRLGYWPYVLVRRSNGKAILRWKRSSILVMVDNWVFR